MRKYENFCNALSNMKDIYNYEEPYEYPLWDRYAIGGYIYEEL